jgi:hypothetical protein
MLSYLIQPEIGLLLMSYEIRLLLQVKPKVDGRFSQQYNNALMIMQTAYNLGARHILYLHFTHKHGLILFIKDNGQLGMNQQSRVNSNSLRYKSTSAISRHRKPLRTLRLPAGCSRQQIGNTTVISDFLAIAKHSK